VVRFGDWKRILLGGFSEKEKKNFLKSTYNLTYFPEGIELYDRRKDTGEAMNSSADFPRM